MDFQTLFDKAKAVREKYKTFEIKNVGHEWTNREIMEGFVGDVGDLMKLVMAMEGSRKIDSASDKLKHELCDCLWCLFILAKNYGVNLETEFMSKMDELDRKIS